MKSLAEALINNDAISGRYLNEYKNILNNANYMLSKLCPEDKDQLNRIEEILKNLSKKKEYVQLRINK